MAGSHHRLSIGASKDRVPILFSEAVARQQGGQHPEAITLYHQILTLDPGLPEANCNMGVALAGFGRLDEAEPRVRRVIMPGRFFSVNAARTSRPHRHDEAPAPPAKAHLITSASKPSISSSNRISRARQTILRHDNGFRARMSSAPASPAAICRCRRCRRGTRVTWFPRPAAAGSHRRHALGCRCKPGGRKTYAEARPEVVALAKELSGRRMSYRKISAELASRGHTTATGRPYVASAVQAMLAD